MISSSLFVLALFFFQSYSECVCVANEGDCSLLINSCGGFFCDFIEVKSNEFNLTTACISSNGGKVPILNFTQSSCSLNLDSNLFELEGGLQIGNTNLSLTGFVNFELFKVFEFKTSNSILIVEENYQSNENSFEITNGQIVFKKQTIFKNSNVTFGCSILSFESESLLIQNSSFNSFYTQLFSSNITIVGSTIVLNDFTTVGVELHSNLTLINSNLSFNSIERDFLFNGFSFYCFNSSISSMSKDFKISMVTARLIDSSFYQKGSNFIIGINSKTTNILIDNTSIDIFVSSTFWMYGMNIVLSSATISMDNMVTYFPDNSDSVMVIQNSNLTFRSSNQFVSNGNEFRCSNSFLDLSTPSSYFLQKQPTEFNHSSLKSHSLSYSSGVLFYSSLVEVLNSFSMNGGNFHSSSLSLLNAVWTVKQNIIFAENSELKYSGLCTNTFSNVYLYATQSTLEIMDNTIINDASYQQSGLHFGVKNNIIFHDNITVSLNTLCVNPNAYIFGNNNMIQAFNLYLSDFSFTNIKEKLSIVNLFYCLVNEMELANNLPQITTTVNIKLFDNSKWIFDDALLPSISSIELFDLSLLSIKNSSTSISIMNINDYSTLEIEGNVTYNLDSLNLFDSGVCKIMNDVEITVNSIKIQNKAIASFENIKGINFVSTPILLGESTLKLKNISTILISNYIGKDDSTIIIENQESLQLPSVNLYQNSNLKISDCGTTTIQSFSPIENSKTFFSNVSSLIFTPNPTLFQNNYNYFGNTVIKVNYFQFYGNSINVFDNSTFQSGNYGYSQVFLNNNCSVTFMNKNTFSFYIYIYTYLTSKVVFDETFENVGNYFCFYQYGNSFIEIKKGATVNFYLLYLFENSLNNFLISSNSRVTTDYLMLYGVTSVEDKLSLLNPKSIYVYQNSNITIRGNHSYTYIYLQINSLINFFDCNIVSGNIYLYQSSLKLHNSVLKTPQLQSYNYQTSVYNELYLYGETKIETDFLNNYGIQKIFVDPESQLFIKAQQNVANIVIDLGNKERKKQVLDIGFEIPQYGIYSFINLPTTHCVDAIYSSVSTTQSTTYSPYPNHVILSNKRVLRVCPNEINKEFQCVLNGSIWQYSFQTNGFSFGTRNCPCGNDGITECSYLPTTKSLTIPTSSETLLFEGSIETIYFTRNTNTRTLNGTFYNIIMPSSIELKISIDTLKNGEPIEYFSTLKCTNDLDYILTNQNTNETITINLNPIKSSETSNIYLPFKIVNIEYSNDLKYKSTVINSGNVINQITLTTEKRLTTNLHNRVNSIYISKSGIVDETKSKSCLSIYTNNQGETTCLFNENYWCQVGEYLDETKTCLKCSNNCERCLNSTYCLVCNDNSTVTVGGSCVEPTENCLVEMGGSCVLCENGYYYDEPSCIKCSDNCEICSDFDSCVICASNYINSNGNCIKPGHSIVTNNNTILKCDENYYSNENGECEICSNVIEGCLICESAIKCSKCSDNYVLNSTNQCVSTQCEIGYVENESGQCVNEILNCLKYLKEECVECEVNYHIKDGKCETQEIPNCSIYSNLIGCSRCSDNYYSNNGICSECSDNCKTCSNSAGYCLSCYDGTFLDLETHKCGLNEEMKDKCEIYSATGGCVKCKEGYYRFGLNCLGCDSKCSYCQDNSTCIVCKPDYFMNYENECQLKSSIIGCSVEISTTDGCTKCNDSYFLYHKECYECSSNCKTCSYSSDYCITCSSDKVFMNNECYEMSQINKCKKISNNECTKCSFWYSPNEDGTQCIKKAEWWFILMIVIILLIIIATIIISTYKVINYLFKRKQRKEQEKTICVFEMERSNVQFKNKICEDVYSNVSFIDFNEDEPEIPVNQETKSLICIGNKGKTPKKIQITLKENCDKYSIRTNPQIITLKKGEACEFEVFITPLCTSKFEDILNIVVLDIKKGKTKIETMKISILTQLSSRLDPDELSTEKKLGEGSFGIVYLGTFRGNKVAIKKIKQMSDEDKQLKEFEKEVTMLDKFRCDYIIHFYGAVFILSKVCMVTEFAQFGSLQDLIKTKLCENPPTIKIKIKMMIDAAKGIQYLHSNGILHRDIKPDNILVVSLEENIPVNAKLTDFGASRNINQMMTNMTFTKGIGTPIYMSPEVLNRQIYKKPSDVYSFAVTMYECFVWKDVYPSVLFKQPWSIADFVAKGERRPPIENIPNEINEIISDSWKQNPKDRMKINDVIERLGLLEE